MQTDIKYKAEKNVLEKSVLIFLHERAVNHLYGVVSHYRQWSSTIK